MASRRICRSLAATAATVWLCLGIAAAGYAGKSLEGRIATPKDHSEVEGVFEASGTVANLPPHHRLWLVVKKGDNLWPKKEAFVVGSRKWSAAIDETSMRPGAPFALVLFSVDQAGQAAIADWYRACEEKNLWPAMQELRGAAALDIVNLRRK